MVGETFGNYEVVATLGKGGVGVVYLAQHHTIARRAAIKVLAPELSKDRDVVKRFFLEALATSLIRHPGIVEVFDYDVEPTGRAYIVMEYLEGETAAGPVGSSCTVAADCQNGLCIDNFCCDGACSGSCQACNNMGQEGHCSLVLSGQPHGLRTPCGAAGSTCGGRCDGTDALCHFPMANQCACPNPLLLGGLVGGTCDGMGNCQTAVGLCIL